MKRVFIIMSIIMFINGYDVNSQVVHNVDKWKEYVEELAQESDDTERIESLYSELSYLCEHPFDLNSVTADDLSRLPFLTERQIESILDYRKRFGKIFSIYELREVNEMDYDTISLLLPFVYVGESGIEKRPITVKNLFKYSSNDLQIRYDRCFQQKSGYCEQPDSIISKYPNRKYLGEPFYNSLRYSYSFDDRVMAGVVTEKDAGEPFINSHHKGYDHYSAHILLKDIGVLKTLALGDYKISFGQGLIISNDFSPSRTAIVTQAERRNNGFRRHFSTNESDFFRGVAATVSLKSLDISLFYSYRKMDASIDSLRFSSIKRDGLHRLPRDWKKRGVLPVGVYGGNIRYAKPNFHVGLTALSYSFGKYSMDPELKPYNRFHFRGSSNINMGVDYMLKSRSLRFYGETAMSKNGAMATLNALAINPASYISLLMLYRYYDRRYNALYANAFSQGSDVRGENGLYMGLKLTPLAYWRVSLYADIFRFPWLRYRVDAPSNGEEYMAQVDYAPKESFSAYIRYKYRRRESNVVADENRNAMIGSYRQQRLRLQLVYQLSTVVTGKSSVDGVLMGDPVESSSFGLMLSQSVGWQPASLPLRLDGFVGWFHTDYYRSRICSYEKNILYAFNMPSFYGEGLRGVITFRLELLKRVSISAKLSHTHYFDRNSIGTDAEEIKGSDKTDVYALLRWKF